MTEAQKWAAYDVARNRLGLLISHYEALISEEERKPAPSSSKISKLAAEQDQIIELNDTLILKLTVENQDEIARINATYGPIVQEIMG